MEPTDTDWAYLAGLIDGEGSLALVHRKRRDRTTMSENSYQCHITIVNTDFKMLDWVRGTFGDYVYFQRSREGRKPLYVYAVQSKKDVAYILRGTLPYLLTKYEVAEAMLHFTETPIWEKEMRKYIYEGFKSIKEEVK